MLSFRFLTVGPIHLQFATICKIYLLAIRQSDDEKRKEVYCLF